MSNESIQVGKHENKAYMKAKHTRILKLFVFADPMHIFSQNSSLASTEVFDFWDQIFSKRVFWVEDTKKWTSPLNSAYWNYSRYKFTDTTVF